MKQKTKAYIALGAVCLLWGTTYIAMRTGAEHMPGLMLAAIRQTVCGILVIVFFLLKGTKVPDAHTLLRLGVIGVLMLGIGNGLMSWGEQTVNSGLASILAALNPVCIILFSMLLIKNTRLTPIAIVGLALGLAGIFTIFYPLLAQPAHAGFAFGTLLIVLSVIGWSSGSVYAAKHNFSLNLLYACGWEFLLGGLALVVFSLVTGHTIPLEQVGHVAWLSIGYLVVFGSLIGFNAYQYALRYLPTPQVALYGYVNPLVAMLLGWWLLHEKMEWHILIGALITLAGIYLVQTSFMKQTRGSTILLRVRKARRRFLKRFYLR